jgi:hypothetical protein
MPSGSFSISLRLKLRIVPDVADIILADHDIDMACPEAPMENAQMVGCPGPAVTG